MVPSNITKVTSGLITIFFFPFKHSSPLFPYQTTFTSSTFPSVTHPTKAPTYTPIKSHSVNGLLIPSLTPSKLQNPPTRKPPETTITKLLRRPNRLPGTATLFGESLDLRATDKRGHPSCHAITFSVKGNCTSH